MSWTKKERKKMENNDVEKGRGEGGRERERVMKDTRC